MSTAHIPHRAPGKVSFMRSPWLDVVLFAAAAAAMVWFLYRGSVRLGYNWQWYRVPRYFFHWQDGGWTAGPLIRGLATTLRITGWSLVLAFVFGLTTALMRLSRSFLARTVARGYLELVRNTPLLVQLFFLYFVLAPVLGIERFTAAVLALSLFEGAYTSEILRSGIVSIHAGQWEAAYSLGLGTFQCYRLVVLPQALRRVLPPLTSQAVSLLKDSALVSTIAVADLTMAGRTIISDTFLTFEVWFAVAAVYLTVAAVLSAVVHHLEGRLRRDG